MTSTTTGIIAHLERLSSSVQGNPRYRVTLEDGRVFTTQSDGQVGYLIGNPEYRGVPVMLSLTRAGRVFDVRAAVGLNTVAEKLAGGEWTMKSAGMTLDRGEGS
jgi:hypothetical protein